tara:strand:+ start:301 stop:462 length:162 start_codon:yes stop_codon:yes gene_type:complete
LKIDIFSLLIIILIIFCSNQIGSEDEANTQECITLDIYLDLGLDINGYYLFDL